MIHLSTQRSLKKRLFIGMISALLVIWAAVSILSFYASADEVAEVYDSSISQYARVLTSMSVYDDAIQHDKSSAPKIIQLIPTPDNSGHEPELFLGFIELEEDDHEDYYEAHAAFTVTTTDGQLIMRSSTIPPDATFKEGFSNIIDNGIKWRVFGMTDKQSGMHIMVAEELSVREEVLAEIAFNSMLPILAAIPIVGWVIWLVIVKSFSAMQTLANTVSSRSPSTLDPISTAHVPEEVEPIINALNQLFIRVEQTLDNERRFTANAAHELRTPLAALKTHSQVLQMHAAEDIQRNVNDIISGIDRTTHWLDQLLALARAEAKSHTGIEFSTTNIIETTQEVLSDLSGNAFKKDLSLSFETSQKHITAATDKALLGIILRNLIDNAIRYTPNSGSIDISIHKNNDNVTIAVCDNGPGIPEHLQNSMFQRFQRGADEKAQGSGLGLSIVKQVASLLHVSLTLSTTNDNHGLTVTIELPIDPT